ncbi:FAD-binding domain-containing protein [uncultured Sulfitobacter sp.]|uniref:FAD-binding domain-containing protein n=1 Tax=uncultured Sulfitobacter sp. TaxID=191468 RepID=UPI00262D3904|nr:FAD-binding domain-containing protein [uncultured Sulfitobacter sp.]
MENALGQFPPTAAAARARLADFAPKAGESYARNRNFDFGPVRHTRVSTLSPYLRLKVLDEADVSRAVLEHMDGDTAEKFLTEVWWRTYWKGWLEQRPTVWAHYRTDLTQLHNDVQTQSGLRNRWETACLGKTGIAPFDAWAHELVRTGYLHNHARMWFASIWIFTLELPWQLGANFFLRHLLDGDAAVNTLSWRWVAGIQTRGKTYLADPDNIAEYSDGRFADVHGLSPTAVPVAAPDAPDRQPIMALARYRPTPGARMGLLLHSDDISAGRLLAHLDLTPVTSAYLDTAARQSPWCIAPHIADFRDAMAQDVNPGTDILRDIQALVHWVRENRLDHIVAPHAPVGATRDVIARYRQRDGAVPVHEIRRDIDSAAWPLATAGFFRFRKHIPELLDRFMRGTAAPDPS